MVSNTEEMVRLQADARRGDLKAMSALDRLEARHSVPVPYEVQLLKEVHAEQRQAVSRPGFIDRCLYPRRESMMWLALKSSDASLLEREHLREEAVRHIVLQYATTLRRSLETVVGEHTQLALDTQSRQEKSALWIYMYWAKGSWPDGPRRAHNVLAHVFSYPKETEDVLCARLRYGARSPMAGKYGPSYSLMLAM